MNIATHPASCRCLAAAWFLAVGGIAHAADPAAADASAPTAAQLMAPVTHLVGDADCDNQSQCKIAGIGAKPCGGPGSYIAWSTKNTDGTALHAALDAQSHAAADENRQRGLASNCMVAPEPTAVCRPRPGDGKTTCQLGQDGVRSAD